MADNRMINPWHWGDPYGFVQGVSSIGASRTVYCAGHGDQRNEDGVPRNTGDMAAQISGSMDNVEKVLEAAGLALTDVVRLNIYTTDVDALMATYDTLSDRLRASGCRASSTLVGVTRLAFPEMLVEIEATAVA